MLSKRDQLIQRIMAERAASQSYDDLIRANFWDRLLELSGLPGAVTLEFLQGAVWAAMGGPADGIVTMKGQDEQ